MKESSYTRDKLVRFFSKLEEEATLAGDWSKVDLWRDVSHWLEKNVCDEYERNLDADMDCESLSEEIFRLETELHRAERDIDDAEKEIEALRVENDKLHDRVAELLLVSDL